jgi:hypothetical protein
MEFNHKFSNVNSYHHKFGFDRSVLEYQHHNTLVSLPSEETDSISKDNTKIKKKKKTIPTQK